MSYAKALTKQIVRLFDGLSSSLLEHLVQYYFDNYGGSGGCEECWETHCLCEECYNALHRKARKMTDIFSPS
jgi:hypothetical protein